MVACVMPDKTIEEWDAEDHIMDVKATLGKANCPAHDSLARATIFNTRRIADMPNRIADQVATTVELSIASAFENGCGEKLARQIAQKSGRINFKSPFGQISFESRDLYRVVMAVIMLWMFWKILGLPNAKQLERDFSHELRHVEKVADAGSR